jgi:uncharacterized membrane protein
VRRADGRILIALLAIALLGLGIAGYLTAVHYTPLPLVCSTTGIVNCAQVTTSAYSVVPGTALPITIPGMGWFGVSGALAALGLAGAWGDGIGLRVVHLVWSGAALLVALGLVYIELVRLHQLCEWCSALHLLLFLSFLLSVRRVQASPEVS